MTEGYLENEDITLRFKKDKFSGFDEIRIKCEYDLHAFHQCGLDFEIDKKTKRIEMDLDDFKYLLKECVCFGCNYIKIEE